MTEGTNRYCDRCWSIILDRGYVDAGDLCDDCFAYIECGIEPRDDELVDVVLVDRLIV